MSQMPSPVANWDYPDPHLYFVTATAAAIDGLEHVNNAEYVRWCEQSAWAHSEHLGLSLDDYRRLDRAMAVRRGEFDYIGAAREGERLCVATWLTATDEKLMLERRFQLVRAEDGATLLRGRWSLVCIQISSGRPRRLPPAFLQVYAAAVVPAGANDS